MNVCKKKKKLQEWMQMMHVLGFKVEKKNKKKSVPLPPKSR